MKTSHIAKLFYDWGWQIKHDEYVNFVDYLKEMLKRNRVMVVKDGENIEAILFYFLTENPEKFLKKGRWSILNDDQEASKIYIDKMVCKKTNRQMVRKIQDAIESQFPNVNVGVWHRAPFDKCVQVYRRGVAHELQSTVSR